MEDNRFWLWFWALLGGCLIAITAIIGAYLDREAERVSKEPVVETCLKHRPSERVGIVR